MNCEMCGREGELHKAIIEGTELTVCNACSKHGKVLQKPKSVFKKIERKKIEREKAPEIIEKIIPDYGAKIRKARTKKQMTQEEFAKKLNIKESLLQKIENSMFKPSLPLARKLEGILKIRLIEEVKEEKVKITKGETESITVGDLIDLE